MGKTDFFFGFLNTDYACHYHDCYEFHYILKGGGFFRQGGNEIPLLPDTFFVTRPGEEHALSIEPELAFYFIRYRPEEGDQAFLEPMGSHYRVSRENRSDFSRLRLLLGGDGHSRQAGGVPSPLFSSHPPGRIP